MVGLSVHQHSVAPVQQWTTRQHKRLQVRCQSADGFCRDKVNTPKPRSELPKGVVEVSFLGAEGQCITVDCPLDTYILDAGLNNGVELPYTCRGGICGDAAGVQGMRRTGGGGAGGPSDVDDLGFVLSEEEVAQGMALLCMARPLTAVKVETQSDWGYSLGVGEWKGATGQISGKDPNHLMTE